MDYKNKYSKNQSPQKFHFIFLKKTLWYTLFKNCSFAMKTNEIHLIFFEKEHCYTLFPNYSTFAMKTNGINFVFFEKEL